LRIEKILLVIAKVFKKVEKFKIVKIDANKNEGERIPVRNLP
jgi:hypothetical protein